MSTYDLAYIYKAIDEFSPSLKKMQDAMVKFEEKTVKTENRLKLFDQRLKSIGANLFKYVTLPLIGFATYSIKNAEQFEKMEIKLRAFTKTAAEAKRLTDFATSEAMKTGFAPEDISDVTRRLAIAKMSEPEIKKRTKELETYSLATGESVQELTSIFSRVNTAKGIMGRMLIGKLAPVATEIRTMGKELGKSDAFMTAFLKKGVGINTFMKAFERLTEQNKNFRKSAEEMRGTLENSFKRMHETVRLMSADLGKAVSNAFGLNGNMEHLADILSDLKPKFKLFLNTNLELVKMIVYIGGVAASLTAVATIARVIIWVIGGLRLAFVGLSNVVSPLLLLAYSFVKAVLAVKNFMDTGLPSIAGLKDTFNALQTGKLSTGQFVEGIRKGMGEANEKTNITSENILGGAATNGNVNVSLNAPPSVAITHEGKKVGSIPFTANVGAYSHGGSS